MNTRLRFKLIAFLIIISLAGLVVFQGYWLKGLYDSLYIQMENNIEEALKMADYQEIFTRLQAIKQEKRESGRSYTHTIQYSDSLSFTKSMKDTVTDNRLNEKQAQITNTIKVDYSDDGEPDQPVDSTLTDYLATINNLENYIQKAFHIEVDHLKPIDFNFYYLQLSKELKKRNIDTETELVITYQENGEEKAYMRLSPHHTSKDSVDHRSWKNAVYFDYPIQTETSLNYRLYLKSPAQVILTQMKGIMISSALLLLLIIIAFTYLLRTILRQKTEEELKTDFTNNMTHELKTPISVSYAAIDALLNFSDSVNDKQRKYLTIVKEQLTHLTGLVEQILTLAVENRSTFHLHPEMIEIVPLVNSLIQQYKVKTDENVNFKVDIPSDSTIIADRTHLYNMLSNLIENALKYADKNISDITLKVETLPEETRLSVSDNGLGISETNQKKVFEKFFRVPNGNLHNVKGYGLGLYYVKDMMGKHNGEVSLKSVQGKGSTFTLHFPNK